MVVPTHSTQPTFIVDTRLDIKEISPYLNANTDGINGNIGYLGIADVASNLAVWVFTRPVQTEVGSFAHYRTLDLVSGKMVDGMLPIPAYTEDFAISNEPADHLGTFIQGVDPVNKYVLLCYGKQKDNQTITTMLALYASQSQQTINQQERCCLNNHFDMRGDTFIENHSVESCSGKTIQSWSDMEPAISMQQALNLPKQTNGWIVSNGIQWVIKTGESLAIFNTDKVREAEFDLPRNLPTGLNNGQTFQIGLLVKCR